MLINNSPESRIHPFNLNISSHRLQFQEFHIRLSQHDVSVFSVSQCLYSFYSYAVWVTFERRDLKVIQREIGRLFRSDSFNPALNEPGDQSESTEPQRTALNNRWESGTVLLVETGRKLGIIKM